MSEPLEFNGERFTPECVREIRYEHIHRYAFARGLVEGLEVLDAACGEGYGSAILSQAAAAVTGVDLSEAAIEHAGRRYEASGLEFKQANCLDLPFEDDSFDCVVSFETLEHLEGHDELLAGFRRVLRPNGFLLISTPDKAVYRDKMGNRNEFHVSELYRKEFEELLARHFPAVRLWGQKLAFHSTLWSLEGGEGTVFHREDGESCHDSSRPPQDAVYLLALCAASEGGLPETSALSLFDDAEESIYEHYHGEIRRNMAAGNVIAQKDREIMELRKALEEKSPVSWWRRFLGRG